MLNRVKYNLSRDALLSLYYTMIHTHFLYCNIVWGGASQIALYKLTGLQKRAIRMITYSGYRASSSPLFKQLGILKLCDIHKLQIYMFMYKCKYNLLPTSCLQFVQLNLVTNRYDFRKDNEFIVTNFHSEIRRKCISVIGPISWNALEHSVQNLSSISMFKKHVVCSFLNGY